MTPSLTVERWPDSSITVYRLADQSAGTLIAWVRRLVRDLEETRQQQRGQPPGSLQPRRMIHDLRACGIPSSPLISHLSVGLSAGRDLAILCAVVSQDRRSATMLQRLINVPDVDGSETLAVRDPSLVWGAGAVVHFIDSFDEALSWLAEVPWRTADGPASSVQIAAS